MNTPDPNFPNSVRPGLIQRLLIHFAGASPSVFPQLSPDVAPEEIGKYTRMGATVLVPFALALGAGSFTIYTLQEEKSLGVALAFGFIWALAILIIDIGIMSQLLKQRPVTLMDQRPRPAAFGQSAPTFTINPQDSGTRRLVLAIVRFCIAATLGMLMSHCLVLAIFHGRVQHRIEEVRTERRSVIENEASPALGALNRSIADARAVAAMPDHDAFLAAWNAWLKSNGGTSLTAVAEKEPHGTTGDQAVLDAVKPYEDRINKLAEDLSKKRTDREFSKLELGKLQGDRANAVEMARAERNGEEKSATWKSDVFGQLPIKTSGFVGKANSHKIFTDTIELGIAAINRESDRLKTREQLVADAEKSLNEAIATKEKVLTDLINDSTKDISEGAAAYRERRSSADAAARQALTAEVARREAELQRLEKERLTRLSPVSGVSYDLMEQTEALHDLAFSKGKTILAMIILVLLCLMFLDLAPLMMKLMHKPGPYEDFLTIRTHYATTAPPVTSSAPAGTGRSRPLNPQRQASGPRRPPPPPMN